MWLQWTEAFWFPPPSSGDVAGGPFPGALADAASLDSSCVCTCGSTLRVAFEGLLSLEVRQRRGRTGVCPQAACHRVSGTSVSSAGTQHCVAVFEDAFGRAAWRRAMFFPGSASGSPFRALMTSCSRCGGTGEARVGRGRFPGLSRPRPSASQLRTPRVGTERARSRRACRGQAIGRPQRAGRTDQTLMLRPLNVARSARGEIFHLALPQSERRFCSAPSAPQQPPRGGL